MSTPKYPTHFEQLMDSIAVFSTKAQTSTHTFELDAYDCAAIVSEIRIRANTLRTTQDELELCRKAYTEQSAARARAAQESCKKNAPVFLTNTEGAK